MGLSSKEQRVGFYMCGTCGAIMAVLATIIYFMFFYYIRVLPYKLYKVTDDLIDIYNSKGKKDKKDDPEMFDKDDPEKLNKEYVYEHILHMPSFIRSMGKKVVNIGTKMTGDETQKNEVTEGGFNFYGAGPLADNYKKHQIENHNDGEAYKNAYEYSRPKKWIGFGMEMGILACAAIIMGFGFAYGGKA